MRRSTGRARDAAAALLAAALATGVLAGPALGATPAPTASLTAAAIVKQSEAAFGARRTFALSGTVREGTATISFEVASADGGAEARGVLRTNGTSVGFLGALSYVTIAKTTYLRGNGAFWRSELATGAGLTAKQAAKAATSLASHWVVAGADAHTLGLGSLTSPRSLASGIFAGVGVVRKGRPTTVHKVRALPLVARAGGTLYVALDGPPLPLELTGKGGGASGTVVFSYPARVQVSTPTGARSLVAAITAAIG